MSRYTWTAYFTLKGLAMLACGGSIATGGIVCLCLVPIVRLLETMEHKS